MFQWRLDHERDLGKLTVEIEFFGVTQWDNSTTVCKQVFNKKNGAELNFWGSISKNSCSKFIFEEHIGPRL